MNKWIDISKGKSMIRSVRLEDYLVEISSKDPGKAVGKLLNYLVTKGVIGIETAMDIAGKPDDHYYHGETDDGSW